MKTADDRSVDVLTFNEQPRKPESAIWYEDNSCRARIDIRNTNLKIDGFQVSDKGYVWIEVVGWRIYSCYYSQSDSLLKFEEEILELEYSVR